MPQSRCLSLGLPLMHKERGERRDFLPELVRFVDQFGPREIVIEEGYGAGMGIPMDEYRGASARLRIGSYEECLDQDLVLVVRCPDGTALTRMRRGAILVSMLHFPTRPGRAAMLDELGIRAISLDCIVDDTGKRLVENLRAVGWIGVREAFRVLSTLYRHFDRPGRRPIRTLVLGAGAVGGHAIQAATRYGDLALRDRMVSGGVAGVEVTAVDFDLTGDENYMLTRLEHTDLLVDATQRPDPTRVVVLNEWIAALPEHTVILDLCVDPYDFSHSPPQIKGIEGVPEGNLDKFIFPPDDRAYDQIPDGVCREHRRTSLSCYSWPGVDPRPCMEVYGAQVEPILRVLFERSIDELKMTGGKYFERAIARGELQGWRQEHGN